MDFLFLFIFSFWDTEVYVASVVSDPVVCSDFGSGEEAWG